ncbi:acyltransferase domain-containing protein, partial [Streptomyces sp. NPDC049577]|uniref:acyltransferase domain-containing protein n=1 Tax=Streptomyces sp. NPDC049577 TaxID=3155153 RepID=UPI003437D371
EAAALVAVRGRLMREQPRGAMLSVQAAEGELRELLPDGVDIAAVNAPGLCVASGPEPGIAELERRLAGPGHGARRLHTSHAFHSAMMEPVVGPLTERVRSAGLRAPERPFVSAVTGEAITAEQAADPGYWGGHARRPVRFADAVRAAVPAGRTVLVEVGPGTTLTALARATLTGRRGLAAVRTMRRPDEPGDDVRTLLLGVGDLWVSGVGVRWEALHDGPRQRVALPGYPFRRESHWTGPRASAASAPAPAPGPAARAVREDGPAGDDGVRRIVALWEDFLGSGTIGAHDDFFELGGHSLLGTQLVNRMTESLGVPVSLRELYAASAGVPARTGESRPESSRLCSKDPAGTCS